MDETTGNPPVSESDSYPSGQTARRVLVATTIGAAGVSPVVTAVRQDYLSGLIVGAPASVVVMLVFVFVVCPAVWSKEPRRQAAALAVLDRLLGRPDKPKRRRHS